MGQRFGCKSGAQKSRLIQGKSQLVAQNAEGIADGSPACPIGGLAGRVGNPKASYLVCGQALLPVRGQFSPNPGFYGVSFLKILVNILR